MVMSDIIPVKISECVNDANLILEVDKSKARLVEIDTRITELETKLANLRKQKTILEANIKDGEELKGISERMKLRETEGIK